MRKTLSVCFLILILSLNANAKDNSARIFDLHERFIFQKAVENVFAKHRSKTNSVLSDEIIINKVEDTLRKSNALEVYWQKNISAAELQAEIDRMASHTKDPKVLSEFFNALNNDPLIIAECFARPLLVDRMIRNLYANDPRFHGALKKGAKVEWQKQTFEKWWDSVKNGFEAKLSTPSYKYQLPKIPSGGEVWTPTSTVNAPVERAGHSAIWTGIEMIVWGGFGPLDTGGRYTPATDSWSAVSTTNAPGPRYFHSAVWSGTYMIIWGGFGTVTWLNDGKRYDVATDSWSDVASLNAPSPRAGQTGIWTGSELIVWGGFNGNTTNTGGRYDPVQDLWTATNTVGAPQDRSSHTAVWTGTEMIVWGGNSSIQDFLDTGGRYNPATDSWTPTSTTGVPDGRQIPTSVWTGTEMIIWGGSNGNPDFYLNSGGRYDPSTDTWLATNLTDAPTARHQHSVVWTGAEMIIWGGQALGNHITDTGGKYDPASDTWIATDQTNAPTGRQDHSGIWTNSEMIIWGGFDGASFVQTGGRYSLPISCIFCDDFEDGVLDPNWTYLKPNWTETAGSLVGVPVKKKAIALATPIFAGCSTCSIQTQIQTAGGVGNKVWLLGWYLSKQDTVELLMKEESDKWVLKQRVGGKVVVKQKGLKAIDPNVFYVALVTFDGTNFQVFIDDLVNPLITMPAVGSPSGTVGFEVKNTTGSFAEISVN